MKFRPYIVRLLWIGAILLVFFFISLFLWLALSSLGDSGGGQAAKAITLTLAICLGFDLVGLVVLLAFAELERTNDGAKPDSNLEDVG